MDEVLSRQPECWKCGHEHHSFFACECGCTAADPFGGIEED